MSREIGDLLAKNFISRRDVKAVQAPDGAYHPHWEDARVPMEDRVRIPWRRQDLNDHVTGTKTFGHYILGQDDKAKFFCFDIDLIDTGWLPSIPQPDPASMVEEQVEAWFDSFVEANPRAAWRDRKHVGRDWMKTQMRMLSAGLAAKIQSELDIRIAAAYSGSKGVHVYGLMPEPLPAKDVRDAAAIVLDATGEWELKKGRHFYKHRDQSKTGYPNFSLEVYPKQDSLAEKDLGNLLRLPLGRNQKSPDPCFFIDLSAPLSELRPVDPIFALTTDNPWAVASA